MKKIILLIMLVAISLGTQAQSHRSRSHQSSRTTTTKKPTTPANFSGSYTMYGSVYRICGLVIDLTLTHEGNGKYSGSISMQDGDEGEDNDVSYWGTAEADVTGTVTGNTITIKVKNFTCEDGEDDENIFEDEDFSDGSTILTITKSGSTYTATPYNAMRSLMPTYKVDKIKVIKEE